MESSSNPIWTRRSSSAKLSLSMSNSSTSSSTTTTTTSNNNEAPSSKIFSSGSARLGSSHRNKNPFDLHSINTSSAALPSPTASGAKSASSAFHLGGGGVFGSFGLKTPKTPGANGSSEALNSGLQSGGNKGGLTASQVVAGTKKPTSPPAPPLSQDAHPLKQTWVVWYRAPGNKFQDYEKSTQKIARFATVEEFWAIYTHLRRPSMLPHVSDYHLFKKGIRPVWEDKENRNGGKWNIRLKKGVANRYWEDLLLAIVGDQFGEAGDDLCGAVLSVRGNEDVLSVWTREDNANCLKIKDIVRRKLGLPQGTRVDWKSHASSLEAVNNKQHHHHQQMKEQNARQQQQQQ